MAAQDAELKLKVSLDLGFFRQQLAGLGQAAAGYNLPVKVQFDRRSVQNELNALGANIRRRSYTLNVNTNLQAEIANAKTLAKELENLGRARAAGQGGVRQQMGMGALLPGPQSGGIGSKEVTKLYKAAAKAGILEFDKEIARTKAAMVAALDLVGRDAIAGLLNGLASQDERLKTAAASIGENLIKTIKGVLGIASPSREFRKIGEDAGKGFELGLLKAMEIAERSATRQMRRMLDRLARMALMVGGMSAAEISRQVGQARALPPVDFPATVPPRQRIAIGPSDTGRALPPGATPGALPGTAFAAQRYLPSALGEEMKRVLREAANAFLDTIRAGIRQVSVRDMGPSISRQPLLGAGRIAGFLPGRPSQASMLELNNILAGAVRTYLQAVAREIAQAPKVPISRQPLLGPGSQVAGLLPAAGDTTPIGQMRFNAVRTGATLGQQQLMRAPSIPAPIGGGGGGIVPPSGGGRGGAGGMGSFGRALGGVNLPGAGVIRELGSEFAFATKQVLLFGQAYKILAFVQSFPGQVGEAVSQLQSFRNTLNSVTGSAEAAGSANEFILAAVEKYNIPLQSARDGFVKLFASMEPAGFAAGEIQNLFLGITKAAATYGMSADKVDRVNYAFAQMASKGQVMSEELKGQLGDVLPGAMGIFAEAAGFKGPDAIQKFGKALEDGVYKGGEMRKLLKGVADGMNKEFGPGAEGAAKTFQGSINRMQNALKGFYESFEPAAIGVLNQVAVPLVATFKNVTDGVNAYFKGQAAATPEAQNFANTLKTLVPTISGIAQNLSVVFTQVSAMGKAFLGAALQVSRLLSLPIVGYLASTYAQVLILSTAFNFLAKGAIGAAIVAISQFIARGVVFAQVSLGMRVATQQTTVAMYQFGTAVQTVMIKSVIGIALVAISSLVAKFVELQNAMAAVSGQSRQMQDAAKASARLGDIAGVKEAIGNMEDRVQTYKALKGQLDKVIGDESTYGFYREIPSALAGELMSLGLIVESSMKKVGSGYKVKIGDLRDAYNLATKNVAEFNKAVDSSQNLVSQAQKKNQQLKQQGVLTGTGEGDAKGLAKAAEDARKLADDKAKYESDLLKMNNIQVIELDNLQFEHWKSLQQEKYNILIAGENSWLSQAIKFQQQLQDVEIGRIEAVRKAREATAKAEINAGAKSYIAGGGGGGGVTGLLQGSTGISSGPHFDVRRADGGRITEAEARALFDAGVNRGLQMTSGYGPRNTGIPGASTFHRGIDLAGATNTPLNLASGYSMVSSGMEGGLGYTANVRGPQGQMYKVGHLQEPSAGGMPASRQRAELKKDYNAALAAQTALNQKEQEGVLIKQANVEAQMKIAALIKEQVALIAPVEEQKLENQLVQQRIALLSSGIFGERLETEAKIAEATEKATLNIGIAKKKIEENNALASEGKLTNQQLTAENQKQLDYISQQEKALANYIPLLRERLGLEQQTAESTLRGQITRATPLGGMGLSAGFIGPAGERFEEAIGRDATQDEASRFAELQNQLTLLETRNEAIKQSIYGIGNAFGEALTTGVASLITGTATAKEVFAGFLQSVGQALSQAASQMIATYIAIGIAKLFAGLGGGGGNPAGSGGGISNSLPGIRQYAGGLGGGGAPGSMPFAPPAFANGGIVTGPTLSLIGEGKYNEAVVPLPDGRSIPVQLGGRSARDMMGGNAPGMPQAPSLSMKFETTKINGVEYVSREQLEQAMAETRRASIAGGAQRGMSMTLDKIKQSPSTRSSIGIR